MSPINIGCCCCCFSFACLLLLVKLTIFERENFLCRLIINHYYAIVFTARKFGRVDDFYFACCQLPLFFCQFWVLLVWLNMCVCGARVFLQMNTQHQRTTQTERERYERGDLSRIISNGLHIPNRITIHSK